MSLFASISRNIISPVVDFIYPPVCVSCNQLLPDGSQQVCRSCWDSIQRITKDLPLYNETRTKLLESGQVSDLVTIYVFEKEGAFQHIAHALKYDGFESLGRELGLRLGERMKEWNISADLLIPIPLHKVKQRERGYNQADLIARGISAATGTPVLSKALRRTRHTQTQTQLSLEERQKNVEDAFEVRKSFLQEVATKKIVLVDDVITTGATIQSCAQKLMGAGALNVIAASAALAQ
jgi:ComF family protein